jgi:6-phosphogluconolactonase
LWLLLFALIAPGAADSSQTSPPDNFFLYVGTYTGKDSKGIYAYRFNPASGDLHSLGVVAETANPSFLAIDSRHRVLYAVNEVQQYQGARAGAVSAFAVDAASGKLSLLNQVSSRGADPCYLSFDKTGQYVLVANYTGGNIAVYPIAASGRLAEASSVLSDTGALGPNHERQDAPHSHWIEVSTNNRFAYVSDLGLDRVLSYKFDADRGTLTSEPTAASGNSSSARLAPGTGPRHAAWGKTGEFMYVLGELDSTVTVFAHDDRQTFRALQRISSLPNGFSGKNDAAEIAIHPNGKFLYTSNRGHDSIARFSIDRKAGTLTLLDHSPTQGKAPRHFEIDPTGRFLFVANQESNSIVVFRLDPASGELTPTGQTLAVPSPVCLKFMPAAPSAGTLRSAAATRAK